VVNKTWFYKQPDIQIKAYKEYYGIRR